MPHADPSASIVQDMTPRQLVLNELWSWFRGLQYENRRYDWDGQERPNLLEFEVAAQGGYATSLTMAEDLPHKFRKPTAPYNLPKAVVERFTSLLVSARRQPKFCVPGDPDTQAWVNAAARVGCLWSETIKGRNYGGATGTCVLGFSFVRGVPRFEAHDPRWVFPEFSPTEAFELIQLEKRYPYVKEEWNAVACRYEERTYWYRRVIDTQKDTLYAPLADDVYKRALKEKRSPPWQVLQEYAHGFGEVPAVWIQNLPVDESIDGEPDCAGAYDTVKAIDALYAQSIAGTLANCDPTLLLKTDSALGDIRLGRDNVVKLNQGDDGKFLEITAEGIKAARELALELRERALEVVSCVLDNNDVGDRATATEVERIYSAMLAKCDIHREQYGTRGLVRLMQKVIRAAQKVSSKTHSNPNDPDGPPMRMSVDLPPHVETHEDGTTTTTEYKLGAGGGEGLVIEWGPYFVPSLNDAKQAADAVGAARLAKVIDRESAVRFIAKAFGIDDPARMLESLNQEAEKAQQEVEDDLERELAKAQASANQLPNPKNPPPPPPPGERKDVK